MANWADDATLWINLTWQSANNLASIYLGAFCIVAEASNISRPDAASVALLSTLKSG
jgi:hypothetical protein